MACEQLIRADFFLQYRFSRIKLQGQLKLDQSTIIVEFLASNADIANYCVGKKLVKVDEV